MIVVYRTDGTIHLVATGTRVTLTWPRHDSPGLRDEVQCVDAAGQLIARFHVHEVLAYRLGGQLIVHREPADRAGSTTTVRCRVPASAGRMRRVP
jgi:hypothetical protein